MKRFLLPLTTFSALFIAQLSHANMTPEPWSSCDGLGWEAIDSPINVHRDNGEYIDTVAGSRGYWTAPDSGSYFLVAVTSTDWRDWMRSDTVYYERNEETKAGCIDPNLFTENTERMVLSETEIEFTWDIDPRFIDRYAHVEVIRFNEITGSSEITLATGSRYYADDLSPDDSYTFALVTYDIYGLAGDSVQIYDGINTRDELGKPNAQQVLPPLALRVEVYSSTAVELFWQNNNDYIQGESKYTVLLDNVPIASDRDGTSLYIDSLLPGSTNAFSVTTTNGNSLTSDPSSITATTFGEAGVGKPMTSNITVDENTISWTDSGWYQVQNAMTYNTLCEGGSNCTVAPGMYIVINHHTGIRETVLVD